MRWPGETVENWVLISRTYGKAPPTKRPSDDAAFRVETLRLASENRSAQAAARALNIRPELLYQWQQTAQASLPAAPAEATEVRALRTAD